MGNGWMVKKSTTTFTETDSVNVHKRLNEWVKKQPNKELFTFLNRQGDVTEQYTYREFSNRVSVIANHLSNRIDIEPGDRLLLLYPPGLEIICALFACSQAGFIAVPAPAPSTANFKSSSDRLEGIIDDSGAKGILLGVEIKAILESNLESADKTDVAENPFQKLKWITTQDMAHQDMAHISDAKRVISTNEIFFLQYTSGSTNQPKGVMVTHENILHNCGLVVEHDTPIAVSWLPQHHDMGLIGYYIYIALSGGTTYGFSPSSFIQRPALWLETITKYRATATSAPNFAFDLCAKNKHISAETLASLDLSSLKVMMAAAEPINVKTYQAFLNKFEPHGLRRKSFNVAYGLAEFTLGATLYGQRILSLHKGHLANGQAKEISNAHEVSEKTTLISCGKVVGDSQIKIVNSNTCGVVHDHQVGEIWISGKSKSLGYWNKPELSRKTFNARLGGQDKNSCSYLRTGDMGFMHDDELYVCGRDKDMIIVRGKNYFPQDIERIVEDNFSQFRRSCVAAFEDTSDGEPSVILVAELVNRRDIPEPRSVVKSIWEGLNLRITRLVFVRPRSIPKTSSGKIRRFQTRQLLEEEKLNVVENHVFEESEQIGDDSELTRLKRRYKLTGDEDFTLLDVGIDSLDLVLFLHWLEELVATKNVAPLPHKIDTRMIGAVTVRELFKLVETLESSQGNDLLYARQIFLARYAENLEIEDKAMRFDSELPFEPKRPDYSKFEKVPSKVLLTGGTGFLGPFLIANILCQTPSIVYILTRDINPEFAMERIRSGLENIGYSEEKLDKFARRIVPIYGDLELPNLGLDQKSWSELAESIDTIYHNGAIVNYLLDYKRMKPTNVSGTSEMLRLAFAGKAKQFNFISTTFIFGWAVKDYLFESDNNDEMKFLNFGYSQSKWVSEQLVHEARKFGLSTRIFRPSLITPSVEGKGENIDITIRLMLFMITHGIRVSLKNQISFTPVEFVAQNIVSIANQEETAGGVFHIVRDKYETMDEIMDIIANKTGRTFHKFSIDEFANEIVQRATTDDLLFPLIDFLIGAVDNISAMESKLYESNMYKNSRNAGKDSSMDPPLEHVVDGILNFIQRKELI